jgi:hypothetical protein
MIMKTLITTAIVALGLLSAAITAQAAPEKQDWAQSAFDNLIN